MPLEARCRFAAEPGTMGLELAPFTPSDAPDTLPPAHARHIRATVESHGLAVTGLHWPLVKPDGLSRTACRGMISVELFKYIPDGAACVARAIRDLRGVLETLEERKP